MTIDQMLEILTKAKTEHGGDTRIVMSKTPKGDIQGNIDRIHVRPASFGETGNVVAIFSLFNQENRPEV